MRWTGLALTAVMLLGAALRLWQIHESLWLDELHTAWAVSSSMAEVPARAAIGNQSPLYFGLVWIVTSVLPMSEFALRLPSLLAGLALVPAAFFLTLRWGGSALAALVAALLVCWDRNFIFYAQEARPYALVQLLAAVQLYLCWRVARSPRPGLRIAFVMTGIALIYLHYTAVLILAAETVWLLAFRTADARNAKYRLRAIALDLGVIALALLPAAAQLSSIASRRTNWSIFLRSWPQIADWFSLSTYVLVPLVGLSAAVLWSWHRSGRLWHYRPERWAVCLVGCWLVVPLLLAWGARQSGVANLFFPRYLVAAALAPIVFTGLCLSACPRGLLRAVLAVLVLCTSLYQSGIAQRSLRDGRVLHDRNEGWKEAVRVVNTDERGKNQPVFVRSGFLEADQLHDSTDPLLQQYCLAPVNSLYRIDKPQQKLVPLPNSDAGQLDAEAINRIQRHGGAWFLINGSAKYHARFEQQLHRSLRSHGLSAQRRHKKTFGHVLVLWVRTARV